MGYEYAEWFWALRDLIGDSSETIKPRDIAEWACACGVLLSREDYSIIMAMDRDYRRQMPKTIEYHQELRNLASRGK